MSYGDEGLGEIHHVQEGQSLESFSLRDGDLCILPLKSRHFRSELGMFDGVQVEDLVS